MSVGVIINCLAVFNGGFLGAAGIVFQTKERNRLTLTFGQVRIEMIKTEYYYQTSLGGNHGSD